MTFYYTAITLTTGYNTSYSPTCMHVNLFAYTMNRYMYM